MRAIDRRSFLALGVGAVAWACARGDPEDASQEQPGGGAGAVSVVVTGLQLAEGDSRQGFAVIRGQKPYVPDRMRVSLTAPGKEPVRVDTERQRVTLGQGGDEDGAEVTDIFTIREAFDDVGLWTIDVVADGTEAKAAFQVQSTEEVESPLVGDRAPATESPTVDDPRGVDPICTRSPRCSMHEMTIEQALESAKPLVVVFGTPRFCTSRTCGPVVDVIEDAKQRLGDEVNFVHVEVWRNDEDAINTQGGEAPAFAEWKLQTEPWTYFIDAGGVVRDRWVGALGSRELLARVEELAGA